MFKSLYDFLEPKIAHDKFTRTRIDHSSNVSSSSVAWDMLTHRHLTYINQNDFVSKVLRGDQTHASTQMYVSGDFELETRNGWIWIGNGSFPGHLPLRMSLVRVDFYCFGGFAVFGGNLHVRRHVRIHDIS